MPSADNARYQPLIVIGAARSGTKLVRDTVAMHPGVDVIPYDINYIWRLGNERLDHDELTPDMVTERTRQKIVRFFGRRNSGRRFIVEKTVSNSLRVPFVREVFPDALFIHLVRDGLDTVESAYRQWLAPPDWRYLLSKASFYPWALAPSYALLYSRDVLRRAIRRKSGRIATWGPRYRGIDLDVLDRELLEVCAIQWARSVESAVRDLSYVPDEQVIRVRYEDFAQDPIHELARIERFCGLEAGWGLGGARSTLVSTERIGRGRRQLGPTQVELIRPHVERPLSLLGYPV